MPTQRLGGPSLIRARYNHKLKRECRIKTIEHRQWLYIENNILYIKFGWENKCCSNKSFNNINKNNNMGFSILCPRAQDKKVKSTQKVHKDT